ncbi:hypothetical protein SAMN05216597_3251 [Pseudomonas cannabina]|nr:hypothetical protein SAMN05216597_3251 [Pseudomonas cannabina]
MLFLRVAVKPALANTYLKADQSYLNYRIPLSRESVSKPINASSDSVETGVTLPAVQIMGEHLDEHQ